MRTLVDQARISHIVGHVRAPELYIYSVFGVPAPRAINKWLQRSSCILGNVCVWDLGSFSTTYIHPSINQSINHPSVVVVVVVVVVVIVIIIINVSRIT